MSTPPGAPVRAPVFAAGDPALKPPPLIYRPPHAPFLPIAHLDEDVVVVDKPSGLLSVPGKGAHLSDCVEARAQAAVPGALIVHRLDMDTSGLILLARSKRAQRILSGQFAKRIICKTYFAVVAGIPDATSGVIDLPLRADWPNRPRQMVCYEHGKPAVTRWEIASQVGADALLKLMPVTGRSHQLRIHLAHMGHPILGDPIYATGAALAGAQRLMLHAARLAWRRPLDGSWVEVTAPEPAAFPPLPL